jgi:hypothetical protein
MGRVPPPTRVGRNDVKAPIRGLVTPGLTATAADLVAGRRPVVGRGDLYRHPPTFGLRQAGNRIAEAVARTRACRMYDYSLVAFWYALDG